MPIPLRVLIVSDREGDAQQLIDALRQSDYIPTSERVATAAALREALAHRWDLILSTDESARLDTLTALEILHESGADVPAGGDLGTDAGGGCPRGPEGRRG